MFDHKAFLIGVLALTAGILTIGHVQLGSTAYANETVQEDDYQLITARTFRGDDALYVLHKRKNLIAMFTWDPNRRSIIPRDVRSMDGIMTAP